MHANEENDTATAYSAAGLNSFNGSSSSSNNTAELPDDISDFSTSLSTTSTKRKRSMQSSPQEDTVDIDSFITDMIAQRNQLRGRFKEWADQVEYTTKRLKNITDNALVNQSGRLERILDEGKKKVDGIVGEQNHIRVQLSSFMSLLASAQEQVFNKNGTTKPK
ncbi:hypothetical protein EC988_006595 [Linderina pennispora]|nr:hypothetical protein EC988_006595 [Linderina pennispora]